jgi:hypothetical protein
VDSNWSTRSGLPSLKKAGNESGKKVDWDEFQLNRPQGIIRRAAAPFQFGRRLIHRIK